MNPKIGPFCPHCGKKLEQPIEGVGLFICRHWFKGKLSEHNLTLIFITNPDGVSVEVIREVKL